MQYYKFELDLGPDKGYELDTWRNSHQVCRYVNDIVPVLMPVF